MQGSSSAPNRAPISRLGVAYLLPGLTQAAHSIEEMRTLFWFTGHPIVFFWLLPAYLSLVRVCAPASGRRLLSV